MSENVIIACRNIYNDIDKISDDNSIYESFNNFIFSSDRRVLHKLLIRYSFFLKTMNLCGDIVECGVFKGSGVFTWAKFIELHCPHEIKKVIGFDYFNSSFVSELANKDRHLMSSVFTRCDTKSEDISDDSIRDKLLSINIPSHKFELIKGDITKTSEKYVKDHIGFRISLLYMDLDLDEPTYKALEYFWDRVVPNGIIVFDEYGYGSWSESDAVDRFIKKHNLTLHKTLVSAPTAYIIK